MKKLGTRLEGESIQRSFSSAKRLVRNRLDIILRDSLSSAALLFLCFVLLLTVVGPHIAPYDYDERSYTEDGTINRYAEPSPEHLLGTNDVGYDVFSRMAYGAKPTILTGFFGGLLLICIGTTIGVVAGYWGGVYEEVLMRFTDFVYGIPFIPTAIVLLAFFNSGFWRTILVIGLILWRASARVIRSQILQIKEREYIKVAKVSGAGPVYIIRKHILPNIMSMVALYFAFGAASAIIHQTGLAFLGFADPFVPSWGNMIRNAHGAGAVGRALWWSIPPGLMIGATVLSVFILGRSFEETDVEQKFNF